MIETTTERAGAQTYFLQKTGAARFKRLLGGAHSEAPREQRQRGRDGGERHHDEDTTTDSA